MIHPTAIIDSNASLAADVSVGAYSIIGAQVKIDSGTTIAAHVTIKGDTTIGRDNHFFSFCSVGDDPQDKKYQGERNSYLKIGDGNVFREYVSINRGTQHGGGVTLIGDNNWIMAYTHIAHDCIIGNSSVFSNNATLAGHVKVDDFVTLGGFTAIHQFCHMGPYSFSAGYSFIVKDVPPYILVAGNTAVPTGLNREGLKRNGFDHDTIDKLKKAYKKVYRDSLTLNAALEALAVLANDSKEVDLMRTFIANSKRGIVR